VSSLEYARERCEGIDGSLVHNGRRINWLPSECEGEILHNGEREKAKKKKCFHRLPQNLRFNDKRSRSNLITTLVEKTGIHVEGSFVETRREWRGKCGILR